TGAAATAAIGGLAAGAIAIVGFAGGGGVSTGGTVATAGPSAAGSRDASAGGGGRAGPGPPGGRGTPPPRGGVRGGGGRGGRGRARALGGARLGLLGIFDDGAHRRHRQVAQAKQFVGAARRIGEPLGLLALRSLDDRLPHQRAAEVGHATDIASWIAC